VSLAPAGAAYVVATYDSLPVPDFGSIPNSLFGPGPIGSGVLDMTMTWSGGGEVTRVRDEENGFVGRRVTGTSHIEFTVGFGTGSYTAASADQVSLVSEVWKERNGVYFS
jgi:hypothetical protein